jgi:anti-sigma regulatory factor (Ser/Thr protein kinase)
MTRHQITNGNTPDISEFTALGAAAIDHELAESELSVRFDRGPTAAAAARSALARLEERIDPRVLDDIRLLVSELVTNAVRHAQAPAGGEVAVEVAIDAPCLRVEVADPGAGFEPLPRADAMTRPGGWGLYLVDQIADRWGVVSNGSNLVWFEIDRAAVSG